MNEDRQVVFTPNEAPAMRP